MEEQITVTSLRDGWTSSEACPDCGEVKRYTKYDERLGRDYTFTRHCACDRREQARNRIKVIKRNGLFADSYGIMTFEAARRYNEKPLNLALKYVDKWEDMQREGLGLLFYGSVGTGKTYIASCIANALLAKDVPTVIIEAQKIVGMSFEQYEAVRGLITTANLLVLDDLGAERATEFARERIFDVVDERIKNNRPLIVTTNYTPMDMGTTTDIRLARIFDRITANTLRVEMAGASVRQKECVKKTERARRILLED